MLFKALWAFWWFSQASEQSACVPNVWSNPDYGYHRYMHNLMAFPNIMALLQRLHARCFPEHHSLIAISCTLIGRNATLQYPALRKLYIYLSQQLNFCTFLYWHRVMYQLSSAFFVALQPLTIVCVIQNGKLLYSCAYYRGFVRWRKSSERNCARDV